LAAEKIAVIILPAGAHFCRCVASAKD